MEKCDKYQSQRNVITYDVPAVLLNDIISDTHTLLKIDIEGPDVECLMQPINFRNMLWLEFSAARVRRKYETGEGWKVLANVLDKLANHFTHVFIPSRAYTKRFWVFDRKQNMRSDYDFMFYAYSLEKDENKLGDTRTPKIEELKQKWTNNGKS